MARQSPLLKYNRLRKEIPLDGCGSHCPICIAKDICEGCNQCAYDNKCPASSCKDCGIRCWRREDLATWVEDVGGLNIDLHSCPTTFNAPELPDYIPQIQYNAFGVQHPAYIINIHRVLHPTELGWCYRKRGIRHHYNVPADSQLILTFCTKDELLEQIWTHSNNWSRGESFWDGVASYAGEAAKNLKGKRDIDASVSVEFSCFADSPRMEHMLNIKRNIISAHELSHRGVPIILDAIVRTDLDLKRTLNWGKRQDVKWYLLNFQRTKTVPWMLKLISSRLEQVFEAGGKAIVNGIANPGMIKALMKKYRGKVSISNTVVSMKTNYYRELNNGQWQKSTLSGAELFQHNLTSYCKLCDLAK